MNDKEISLLYISYPVFKRCKPKVDTFLTGTRELNMADIGAVRTRQEIRSPNIIVEMRGIVLWGCSKFS